MESETEAAGDTSITTQTQDSVADRHEDVLPTPPMPSEISTPTDDVQADTPAPDVAVAPIRLGVIDYLNVVPVYDWLLARERDGERESGDEGLSSIATAAGVPSRMNEALLAGEIDISNVSSVAFGRHAREWRLVPGLSVAAHGPVQSVLLFSWQADWHELDEGSIAVSSDSATSVALAKLLGEQRHSARSTYVSMPPDLEAMLADHDAALLIGDIALVEGQSRRAIGGRRPHVFDLATEWQEWTRLPFVFSVWAAREERAEAIRESGVLELLRTSKAHGLADLERLAREAAERLELPYDACLSYMRLLDYELGESDLAGLRKFLELAIPEFCWSDVRFIEA